MYQFKRGTLQDLASSVRRVLELEGYTAEPEAIQAIARSAEGSWRDALSLLEQVLAYSEGHVTAETVHQAIGTVGTETLSRVAEALARGSWEETLALAAELIDSGKDVRQLLTALTGHLRDLLLIAAGAKQAAAQELGAERLALLTPQAALFDPPRLVAMMDQLAKAEREIRFAANHRWTLEGTLLRLMPGMLNVGSRELAVERPSPPAPENRAVRTAPPLAATPTVVPKPPTPAVTPAPETPFITSADEADESSDLEDEADTLEEADESPVVPALVMPVAAAPIETPRVREETPPATPSPAAASASRYADEVTLEVVQRAWPRILKMFQKASPSGIPFLEKAEVAGLEGNVIVLAFSDGFARDRIQNNAKGRAKVEATINQALSLEGYKIRCDLISKNGDNGSYGGAESAAGRSVSSASVSSGAALEMPTLLDAPPTAPTTTRIADFDLPVEPPLTAPAPHKNGTNGASKPVLPPAPAPPQEPHPPNGQGLLAETLELFGGEVIRSERIANDA